MGLRIQNNIAAMGAHRNLQAADTAMSKSLERLSSGYRINKAADDAAGLSISQGFRADIASFKVASRNTSEAAALLQVAEGGMDQIGNMLTRLKELATQAASANVGSTERGKIDAEATALTDEIDRIANSTKYGSTALLTGTFGASQTGTIGASTAGVGVISDNIIYNFDAANTGASVTALGAGVDEGSTWGLFVNTTTTTAYIANNATWSTATVKEQITISAGTTTLAFANIGITVVLSAAASATLTAISAAMSATTTDLMTFKRTGLTSLNIANAAVGTYSISDAGTGTIKIVNSAGTVSQELAFQGAGETLNFDVLNVSFVLGSDYDAGDLNNAEVTVAANSAASGNVFQVGAQNNTDNQIAITIGGAGVTTLGLGSLDLSTASGAQAALTSIDSAISTLAGTRGDVGAYMNRLSYAAANLATTIENVQAAESVIRDVDMADEMTSFTKNQILLQAGTSMLAQANQAPQQILSLFQ